MENFVDTATSEYDAAARAQDQVDQLAQTIRDSASSGGSTARTGTVMVDPLDGWTQIDLGGGELVQAKVAGQFRSTVKAGQQVRIAAQGGGVWYIGEILTPLDAPAVAAPPSAASAVSGSVATVSASLGYYHQANTANFGEVNQELMNIETVLNALVAALDDVIQAHNASASVVSGVVSGVNSVVGKVNSTITTTGDLRTALLDQGHIT